MTILLLNLPLCSISRCISVSFGLFFLELEKMKLLRFRGNEITGKIIRKLFMILIYAARVLSRKDIKIYIPASSRGG